MHYALLIMNCSEHLTDSTDSGNKGIYFFFGVIESERGTDGATDTQTVHQRLGTMVTCSDGYT